MFTLPCSQIEHILPRNEKFRVAIVIFVVPFIVNVRNVQQKDAAKLITPSLSCSLSGGHVLDRGQSFDAEGKEGPLKDPQCTLPQRWAGLRSVADGEQRLRVRLRDEADCCSHSNR